MFANCSLMGMSMGFPDVCLTPIPSPVGPIPVPLPYPNIALLPTMLPPTTSIRHLLTMLPAHNIVSTAPMTKGDQAGVMMGVMSGMIMGPSRNLVGSARVFTGGTPAARWLGNTMQNMVNCPAGLNLVPSQFRVMNLS